MQLVYVNSKIRVEVPETTPQLLLLDYSLCNFLLRLPNFVSNDKIMSPRNKVLTT